MDYRTLIYQPGRVARVILNRPAKLNAQTFRMLQEMDHAFHAAVKDPACRVIVLSGAGRTFSAGHDLTSEDQRNEIQDQAAHLAPYDRGLLSRDIYTDSHLRWRDLPKPMIAMVHGQCIYGGWMIAAAMDFIFAADDTIFLPTYGDYFTANFDVGPRRAKELLFANRVMAAEEAVAWGFVNRLYPADALEAETLDYAERVAEQDPAGVRLNKFAINQAMDNMGFSTSVRAVGSSFITRAYPDPRRAGDPEPDAGRGPRPAGLDLGGLFRNRVTQALAYFQRDQAKQRQRAKSA
jgi:enoyl-CoA hydratase